MSPNKLLVCLLVINLAFHVRGEAPASTTETLTVTAATPTGTDPRRFKDCPTCMRRNLKWCGIAAVPPFDQEDDGECVTRDVTRCPNPKHLVFDLPVQCYVKCLDCIYAGRGGYLWCANSTFGRCYTKEHPCWGSPNVMAELPYECNEIGRIYGVLPNQLPGGGNSAVTTGTPTSTSTAAAPTSVGTPSTGTGQDKKDKKDKKSKGGKKGKADGKERGKTKKKAKGCTGTKASTSTTPRDASPIEEVDVENMEKLTSASTKAVSTTEEKTKPEALSSTGDAAQYTDCPSCIQAKNHWSTNLYHPTSVSETVDGVCESPPSETSCDDPNHTKINDINRCYANCKSCIAAGKGNNAWCDLGAYGACFQKLSGGGDPCLKMSMKDKPEQCKDAEPVHYKTCRSCIDAENFWCTDRYLPPKGKDEDDGVCTPHGTLCLDPNHHVVYHHKPHLCNVNCESCVNDTHGVFGWCDYGDYSVCVRASRARSLCPYPITKENAAECSKPNTPTNASTNGPAGTAQSGPVAP